MSRCDLCNNIIYKCHFVEGDGIIIAWCHKCFVANKQYVKAEYDPTTARRA